MSRRKRHEKDETNLKGNFIGKGFLSHDAPHFINVGEGIEVFVIMVIKGTFIGHLPKVVFIARETEQTGKLQF